MKVPIKYIKKGFLLLIAVFILYLIFSYILPVFLISHNFAQSIKTKNYKKIENYLAEDLEISDDEGWIRVGFSTKKYLEPQTLYSSEFKYDTPSLVNLSFVDLFTIRLHYTVKVSRGADDNEGGLIFFMVILKKTALSFELTYMEGDI